MRQEKGLLRAEAVMDQLQKKVEGAWQREGRRRERRKMWEEVNGGVDGAAKRATRKFGAIGLAGEGQWEEDVEKASGDRDGDREMGGLDGVEAPVEGVVGVWESTVPAEPVVAEAAAAATAAGAAAAAAAAAGGGGGGGGEENIVAADHATSLNGVEFEDEIT
jgi:hypothetical protein